MSDDLRRPLRYGVRTLNIHGREGLWCCFCNCFVEKADHLEDAGDCPYAALAAALSRLEAAERQLRLADALVEAVALLPCLEKASTNGKGVVPVPEWIVAEIAPVLAAYRAGRETNV